MRLLTTSVAVGIITLTGGARTVAAEDPQPGRAPVAEALFRDGRKLMEAGSYAQACVKLGESYRIDPRIGTLLNLAACHDLEGRTATAWAEYAQAASEAERAGRSKDESFARSNVTQLEARLARLILTADRPPEGFAVSLDGQRLGTGSTVLQTSLPVDPGKHRVSATAPGRAAFTTDIEISPGPSMRTLAIPDLPLVAPVTPAVSLPPRAEQVERSPAPGDTKTGLSPLVWGFGGATLIGGGVGGYFGLKAFSKNREAASHCPGGLCTPDGKTADTDGRHAATASTVAFGIAGAAAALTVYFLVSGSTAQVALSPTGVGLRSSW